MLQNKVTKSKQLEFGEHDFLCGMLRGFIVGAACPNIPDDLDWDRLERIVARNGLIPIFQSLLNASQIQQRRLEKWQHISIDVLLKYKRSLKATVILLGFLEKEGIRAVVLRGMALTQWVYPDPILRPMVDVDILISSATRHNFVDRMKKYGLSPVYILRSQFVYKINSIKFEIHWSFLTPKRYREAADFSVWLASRKTIKTTEGKIYCLSPENELLGLICHAFIHHELDTLLKLVDIAMISWREDLDWDYLHRWFSEASLTRLFYFTMAYIDYLFDLGIKNRLPSVGSHLPPHAKKVFEAYASRSFGEDFLSHLLRRKKNMLFVAEQPIVKLKQLLRFLSPDGILKISRFL